MERNSVKQKSRPTPKGKVYQATAEILKINGRNLPQRLGLLLRNDEGQEQWFSWWSNGDQPDFPELAPGDRVKVCYKLKPPKKKGAEPFFNITRLEKADSKGISDRVREVLAQDAARQVSIRAGVAIKAAAQTGWAKDGDDLFALANACYDWLLSKEEAEVEKLLGKEVSEGGQGS